MSSDTDRAYAIADPDEVADSYAKSDVPDEFRRLTDAFHGDQLAVTLIRIPAHCDFEQRTGRHHDEIEEVYLITRRTLTMRFFDAIETVRAPAAVWVAPGTIRSHRNEGDEDVEIWAISRQLGRAWCHEGRRFLDGLARRPPDARLSDSVRPRGGCRFRP